MKYLVPVIGLAAAACASAETTATPAADAAVGRIDAAPRPDAAMVDAPLIDAPPPSNCETTVTCATAMSLGSVSGDTNADMLTASGYQAAWFRVRVTEDNSSAPGLALRVAATLTVPAGSDFQTFVYVNAGADVIECNTTTGTVSTIGNTREVRAEWGEGFIPNGLDDGRDVTIEVRPSAGTTCSSAQTWQLRIDGNWL